MDDLIPARDLRPGMVVSRSEWAEGTPVRILTIVHAQDETFVHYQDIACRQPKHSDTIPAGTLVTLNPRTPDRPTPGSWWRRAEAVLEVLFTTVLALIAVATIIAAIHDLLAGPAHLTAVAALIVHTGLLGGCVYLACTFRARRKKADR